MQCTYVSQLLFRDAHMLRNYAFWGFTAADGFDSVASDAIHVSDSVAIGSVPSIQALGLFATEPMEPDTLIGEYAGLLQAEADTGRGFDPYGLSYPSVYSGGQLFVSAREYGNEMRCVNHSSRPNARFTPRVRRGILHVFCVRCIWCIVPSPVQRHLTPFDMQVTSKAIGAGEQILVDYGASYWRVAGFKPIDC